MITPGGALLAALASADLAGLTGTGLSDRIPSCRDLGGDFGGESLSGRTHGRDHPSKTLERWSMETRCKEAVAQGFLKGPAHTPRTGRSIRPTRAGPARALSGQDRGQCQMMKVRSGSCPINTGHDSRTPRRASRTGSPPDRCEVRPTEAVAQITRAEPGQQGTRQDGLFYQMVAAPVAAVNKQKSRSPATSRAGSPVSSTAQDSYGGPGCRRARRVRNPSRFRHPNRPARRAWVRFWLRPVDPFSEVMNIPVRLPAIRALQAPSFGWRATSGAPKHQVTCHLPSSNVRRDRQSRAWKPPRRASALARHQPARRFSGRSSRRTHPGRRSGRQYRAIRSPRFGPS